MRSQHHAAFYFIIGFLFISLILLLAGQTMALIDYDFAVETGLQEHIDEVTVLGVEMNKAFGASDTFVYIPLIVIALVGLIGRKSWALIPTAAVMGISAYWSVTMIFALLFFEGTPGYRLQPGMEYWIILSTYTLFGVWGLLYLSTRGAVLLQKLK